jgi:hypothetical protein
VPAARHLANVIDAVFATREPFESASKTTVLDWLANPAVGLRSEHACCAANSPEAARQLSAAHELWTVCARWRSRARCVIVCCTADDLGGSYVTASKYAVISFAGAVLAGCALGMAANAQADDNCDPFLLSMTPQPVLACQAPDVAPPPDQPAVAPVNDVAVPLPAEVPPPAEPGPFGDVQAPVPLLLPDGSVR